MSDPAVSTPANSTDQTHHSLEEIRILHDIYINNRIQEQLQFYSSRIRENQLNSDFTFGFGTLIMTLSSLLATISAASAVPVLALISAILPAFAAMLAAFRQLYGWDRQINIYRDTMLGLERIKLIVPDEDRLTLETLAEVFPRLVNSAETVFTAEVSQWGQFVTAQQEGEGEGQAKDPLEQLIASLNLTGSQVSAVQNIIGAGAPPASATRLESFAAEAAAETGEPPAEAPATEQGAQPAELRVASLWNIPVGAGPAPKSTNAPETLPEAEDPGARAAEPAAPEDEDAEKQPGGFGR